MNNERDRRSHYYWIVARDPETRRPYLLPGGKTEQEARQKGLEQLNGIDFELRRFPTTDIGRASAMLKGRRLEKTKSLHKSVEHLGHSKTLRRNQRKRDKKRTPSFGDGGF